MVFPNYLNRKSLYLCIGMLFLLSFEAYAFKESHIKRLDKSGNCKSCKLNGADLSGVIAFGADLRRVNLSGANMMGAYLHSADLTKADLSAANFTDAYLRGVNWQCLKLDRVVLNNANLVHADLSGSDLSYGEACKANFD